jgi:hypothetical protein
MTRGGRRDKLVETREPEQAHKAESAQAIDGRRALSRSAIARDGKPGTPRCCHIPAVPQKSNCRTMIWNKETAAVTEVLQHATSDCNKANQKPSFFRFGGGLGMLAKTHLQLPRQSTVCPAGLIAPDLRLMMAL